MQSEHLSFERWSIMNYNEEKKRYVSYCGSYCRTCDWFTGKIRKTFQAALDMMETYGFNRVLKGKVDVENMKEGLRLLANSSIDPGCKADLAERFSKGEKPENDRCQIRQCCFSKGFDLCCECSSFPCDLLKSNPGVVKFNCIENLMEIRQIGIEQWLNKHWDKYVKEEIGQCSGNC